LRVGAFPPPERRLRFGEVGAQQQELLVPTSQLFDSVPAIREVGDGGKQASIDGMATLVLETARRVIPQKPASSFA
jgi:hypothetical protein